MSSRVYFRRAFWPGDVSWAWETETVNNTVRAVWIFFIMSEIDLNDCEKLHTWVTESSTYIHVPFFFCKNGLGQLCCLVMSTTNSFRHTGISQIIYHPPQREAYGGVKGYNRCTPASNTRQLEIIIGIKIFFSRQLIHAN